MELAMAKMTVLVCDKCGKQDGVSTYEIKHDGGSAKVDLCKEDAAPLAELLKAGTPTPRRGRPKGSTAARAPRGTSMAEIDKLKKK
jgi:hypothetical protein